MTRRRIRNAIIRGSGAAALAAFVAACGADGAPEPPTRAEVVPAAAVMAPVQR